MPGRAVTGEATPPPGTLSRPSGFPGQAFVWQGARREHAGGM